MAAASSSAGWLPSSDKIAEILHSRSSQIDGWMATYCKHCETGGTGVMEVEARVRGVTKDGFYAVLRQLLTNPSWTAAEYRESIAFTLPDRSRLSHVVKVEPGLAPAARFVGVPTSGLATLPAVGGDTGSIGKGAWLEEHKKKEKPNDITVAIVAEVGAAAASAAGRAAGVTHTDAPARGGDGRSDWRELRRLGQVRLQMSHEMPSSVQTPSESAIASYEQRSFTRIKKRWSFVHKGEVQYDITLVQEGRSLNQAKRASPNYEAELEWCGSHTIQPREAATKLLYKVADVMTLLANSARQGGQHTAAAVAAKPVRSSGVPIVAGRGSGVPIVAVAKRGRPVESTTTAATSQPAAAAVTAAAVTAAAGSGAPDVISFKPKEPTTIEAGTDDIDKFESKRSNV